MAAGGSARRTEDAVAFQRHVRNDVQFHSGGVEAALGKQLQHATQIAASLEKRLFALQAELQQNQDACKAAAAVIDELRDARAHTPRISQKNILASPAKTRGGLLNDDPSLVENAIHSVQLHVDALIASQTEITREESVLRDQIAWIHALIRRDGDCLFSLSCRKNRVNEYVTGGGTSVQLSREMSPTDWPEQANRSYLMAATVIKKSGMERKAAYDACHEAQLTSARVKKAATDRIFFSVAAQLEQRHAIRCKLESVSKTAHDTSKTLAGAKRDLDELKVPLKAVLARNMARNHTADAVGNALNEEKETVVRGYRQLRHVARQLERDLTVLRDSESVMRAELARLEQNIDTETAAMKSQNAIRLTIAPQPPERACLRTYFQRRPDGSPRDALSAPANPISWDPSLPAPPPQPLRLWQVVPPVSRRDRKASPGADRRALQPSKPAPRRRPEPIAGR